MSYGDRVLDWLLRHRDQAVPLTGCDLVLVWEHPALADTTDQATLRGEPWRIAHVTGELTLRDALPEAGRLVAIVPTRFAAPADLAGRAWFGRPLKVEARDLVAAATSRPCPPLLDDALADAVGHHWPALRDQAPGWSAEGPVTAREVRDVVLSVQLGVKQRLDRLRPDDLLARWLVDGIPNQADGAATQVNALLGQALVDAHGREGRWLAWALGVSDGLDLLVTAGALAGLGDLPVDLKERIPAVGNAHDRLALGRLVEVAVRQAFPRHATRIVERLASAESRAAQLPPEQAERFPLLRGPMVKALRWHLQESGAGLPPADARIEALTGNVHAREWMPSIELARAGARLARFIAAAGPVDGAAWFDRARTDVAWADMAFREVRRRMAEAPSELAALAQAVVDNFVTHRNLLDESFAHWLAASWPAVTANKDPSRPLPLHQVTRCLVRPLLDAGHRVLLVVLDGCDLSTFVEMSQRLPADAGFGVGLPHFRAPQLLDDLHTTHGFGLGVSLLPTVTSHARRALFAGEIPGSAGLDATEVAAANATADLAAFARNPSLGTVRRKLLLKGDVESRPEAVRDALASDADLVAVVYNAVDDALSSKQTTPFSAWSFSDLGSDVLATLNHALADGWIVLVTADHGHTPFVDNKRKAAASAIGNRYADTELPGAVRFDQGPLPRKPLWLLARFGAWAGTQHRGWHGGASLEEVVVPLAFLTRCEPGQGRLTAPTWWWHRPDVATATSLGSSLPTVVLPPTPKPAPVAVAMPVPVPVPVAKAVAVVPAAPAIGTLPFAPPPATPAPAWAAAVPDEAVLAVFLYLHKHDSIDERDVVALLGGRRAANGFLLRYEQHLAAVPFRIRIEQHAAGKRYVKES